MGKKRSGEQQKDHLLKKLRKLEKRVRKLNESNQSSDNENDFEKDGIITPVNESPVVQEDIENIPPETYQCTHPEPNENTEPIDNLVDLDVETETLQEVNLDDNVLEILGTAPSTEKLGESLHKQIAQRWDIIFKKGLSKEEKDIIGKENPPFINLNQMKPPKLNPEVKAAVNESSRKRDQIIQNRQQQISTALSCLGSGLQLCVKDIHHEKMNIIKKINDAARLLCDSLYLDTRGRRSLLLSIINKDMKEFLLQSEPDTYLFGENLTEKIKTAKSVQKSGRDLKVSEPAKRSTPRQNTMLSRTIAKNKTLNWRGPPRTEVKKSSASGGPRRTAADKKREEKKFQRRRK